MNMDAQERDLKEKAFDDFIDKSVYEDATDAIWNLAKAAYNDAWEKARALSAKESNNV